MSSTEAKIGGLRGVYVETSARWAGADFDRVLARCESPIERLLVAELLAQRWADIDREPITPRESELVRSRRSSNRYPEISTSPQFPVSCGHNEYRLDLAIVIDWGHAEAASWQRVAWVAVECDGHDFHERTKAQASKDRSRDRALVQAGWFVVRFTGSEIHSNPEGCVAELIRVLLSTDPRRK